MKDPIYFQASFNRPNLFYEIREKKGSNFESTLPAMLKSDFSGQTGIIYCMTKKETESLCKNLQTRGIKCEFFHADLSVESRKEI